MGQIQSRVLKLNPSASALVVVGSTTSLPTQEYFSPKGFEPLSTRTLSVPNFGHSGLRNPETELRYMSGGSCAWPMRRSSVCIQSYRARHVQVCEAPILAAHVRRAGQIGSPSGSSPGAPVHRRAQDGSDRDSSPAATSTVVPRTVLLAEAGLGDHGRRAAQDRFLTDSTSSSARRARRALASLIRPPPNIHH